MKNINMNEMLSKVVGFRKDKASVYYKDGIRLFRLGEKEAAIKEFKKAMLFNPKFNKSLPKEEIAYSTALVYRSMEDTKNELKYYTKALYYNPRFYNGWLWKGIRYMSLSNKKDFMVLRGRMHVPLNSTKRLYREAIFCFTNAIKCSEDNPKPYYYAGCCYEKMGNSKKAVEMFDHVFEFEPDFENKNKSKIFDKIKYDPADKTECPSCKIKVKQGDAFCADCGTALK